MNSRITNSKTKQNVTAIQAKTILEKSGLNVDEKQAQAMVDFLYKLAISNAKSDFPEKVYNASLD